MERRSSMGGYPGCDLHLWNVLSVRANRCARERQGEDGWWEKMIVSHKEQSIFLLQLAMYFSKS